MCIGLWLLRSETMVELIESVFSMLGEELQSTNVRRYLSQRAIAATVGGRRAAIGDKVADIIRECDDPLPIVDVLVKGAVTAAASG